MALGSIMGSGAFVVLDEEDCMVSIAKFFLDFTADESCGKCTPCRIGNQRLLEILKRITEGEGKEENMYELEYLGKVICDTALCGLGQSSPNPVLASLRFFIDEYKEHIHDKRCKAGVCTALLRFIVMEDKCTGCTLCARNCPVMCISGAPRKPHVIDNKKCIKCGLCLSKCPRDAIVRI
jgi:Na+-translocating ferredoxin:NAD+ oxidoreductase RNF subunit RnfB